MSLEIQEIITINIHSIFDSLICIYIFIFIRNYYCIYYLTLCANSMLNIDEIHLNQMISQID